MLQVEQCTEMHRYSEAEKFSVVEINVPEIGDDDVLVCYNRPGCNSKY